jgi:hypothetical protein
MTNDLELTLMKSRFLHLLLVAAFLGLLGLVHGIWTNRWSPLAASEGKDLLDSLDGTIGDWLPGDRLQIDPADIPAKTACKSRQFVPLKPGKPMVVSITSGGPGAVAVHTPDVCYLGAGYKLKGDVTRQMIPIGDGGASAAFWVGDFVKTTATGSETNRVRWSWSADGNWQAPDYPRWFFARTTVLYKMYIVQPLAEEDDLTRDDPYRTFIASLIQLLNRQLAP